MRPSHEPSPEPSPTSPAPDRPVGRSGSRPVIRLALATSALVPLIVGCSQSAGSISAAPPVAQAPAPQDTALAADPAGHGVRVKPTPTPSARPTGSPAPSPTPTVSSARSVVVDAGARGATISRNVLGASLAVWSDVTVPGTASYVKQTGIALTRWPGGSDSDAYHWQTNSLCGGGYTNANSTFDNFMNDIVIPDGLQTAITVNYGSNSACTGGGDPAEAAAWVDHANNAKHYGIKLWTVGNEVFGSWEYDLHAPAHDATTYAGAVATGYYPQIKAKDPTAQVGVVVAGDFMPSWDQIVLSRAKYDFVELHWYAQNPGSESDGYLLQQAPGALATELRHLKSELATAGRSTTPIYVGEYNSVSSSPGKQTVSIVNGLFAAMATGEMLKAGVTDATWWIAEGSCGVNNQSTSLYGWQNFGSYGLYSDGTPEPYGGCPSAQSTAFGTMYPAGRTMQLLQTFAQPGGAMLTPTVGSSLTNVRAYAATQGTGYAVLLVNVDPSSTATPTISLTNAARSAFTATAHSYGKAQYDQSQRGQWPGLTTTSLGTVGSSFPVTLPPYTMTVVTLQ